VQPLAELADRARLARVFPQRHHRDVLRVGKAGLIKERRVGADDRPACGVQGEAELSVELELRITGHAGIISVA